MSISNITNSEYIIRCRRNKINVINHQYLLDKTKVEIVLDDNGEPTDYHAHIETYKVQIPKSIIGVILNLKYCSNKKLL